MYDWTADIRQKVESYREELELEFDGFKLVDEMDDEDPRRYNPRTAYLVLQGEGWEVCATLSDGHADNRLVIQDYPPEE